MTWLTNSLWVLASSSRASFQRHHLQISRFEAVEHHIQRYAATAPNSFLRVSRAGMVDQDLLHNVGRGLCQPHAIQHLGQGIARLQSQPGFIEQHHGLQAVVRSSSALLTHQSGRPRAELGPELGGQPFLRIRVPSPERFQGPRQLLALVPFHRNRSRIRKKSSRASEIIFALTCRERLGGRRQDPVVIDPDLP